MPQEEDLTLLALKDLARMIRGAAIDASFEAARLRQKYNQNQPRAPRGTPNGGQWVSDGFGGGSSYGGGRFSPGQAPKNPFLRPASENDDRSLPRTRPRNPMDPVAGPKAPGRGGSNGLTDSELAIIEGERASIISAGRSQGRRFLEKPATEKLTTHGNLRMNQRLPSQSEIDNAVSSAIKSGNIIRQKGKYGSYQYHYKGDNGLTVIIETEGRNAGKVITTFTEKAGGKL